MSKTDELLKLKELLERGGITQDEYESEKEKLMSPKIESGKLTFGAYITIALVLTVCLSIIFSFFSGESNESKQTHKNQAETESSMQNQFESELPISITASLYDNILGIPELKCNIKNNSDKEILAIKFYFEPKDVYGEKIDNIFTTKHLETDNSIQSKESTSRSWQLLNEDVKSGDLYIYSIYFSDGSQWGEMSASLSDLKKFGFKLEVKY